MFNSLSNLFYSTELRKKLMFTFLLICVCRVCSFVPIPGIDTDIALSYFRQVNSDSSSIFNIVDIFSGGAFAQMTIGALGVVPYISSSIILQLVVAIIPSFHRELKENGEYARRKINRWTRMLTFILAISQSSMFAKYALSINNDYPGIVSDNILSIKFCGMPLLFFFLFTFVMTCGTFVIIWIGDQISDCGIGNGISLIISTGILSSIPKMLSLIISKMELSSVSGDGLSIYFVIFLFCLFVSIIGGCICLNCGDRKIPLQYARHSIGTPELSQKSSFLSLKVNFSGVMPIIFASSVLMFPATAIKFFSGGSYGILVKISSFLRPGSLSHSFFYALLILFFNYFWTATQFHPDQIVSEMKKSGAFIPSLRHGSPTQDFIENCMNSLTFISSICLICLAELPHVVSTFLSLDYSIAYFFGGTSILILVGVVIDTIKQVKSYLVTHKYGYVVRKSNVKLK